MNIKQDINMSRKPIDLEIKYKLTEINPTIEEVETLKNKVVVEGGGTNTLKNNEVLVEGNNIKIKENNQIKELGSSSSNKLI